VGLVDPPARLVTPTFALLWGASFAVFLSFYLLLPILPVRALGLGMGEVAVGLVIGAFAFASMVLKPWAGWVLDWRGRRTILIAGAALFVLASLAYPATRSAAGFLIVRLVHGAGMGLFPTAAVAAVADLAPVARRGEAMGLFGMAANLGLALGPPLGGAVEARVGFTGLCLLAGILAAVGLGLSLRVPETGRAIARPPFRVTDLFAPRALHPAAITFLLFLHYGAVTTFLPLLARERSLGSPGLFFTLMAVALLVVRTRAGQLSDRYGRGAVVAPALALVAASLLVVGTARSPWALYGAGLLFGLGLGAAQPALMAWAADLVPAADRGKAMATFYTAWELGIGLGAVLLGFLLVVASFDALFAASAALAVVGSGLAMRRSPRAVSPG
jgi:MFS family permease